MAKVVIHVFHGDEDSLVAGSHVAERVRRTWRAAGTDQALQDGTVINF